MILKLCSRLLLKSYLDLYLFLLQPLERMTKKPKIVGILNITRDSFSDGGKYLKPSLAIEKAIQMVGGGADIIDLGAQSTHPDAEIITEDEEIRRLSEIVPELLKKNIPLSIDTFRPGVISKALEWGVYMINDVTALSDPISVRILKDASCHIVIMCSRNLSPKAEKNSQNGELTFDYIMEFLKNRIKNLSELGIERDRLIVDPGMGFFIGDKEETSFKVLKNLNALKSFGLRTFISVSRKSFIGKCLNKPPLERDGGTLSAELWAFNSGVDFIRTHEPEKLSDGIKIWQSIENS